MNNPAQMVQIMAAMPEPQRAQFAQSLGMSPEQVLYTPSPSPSHNHITVVLFY